MKTLLYTKHLLRGLCLAITVSFLSCSEEIIPEGPNGEPAVIIEKENVLDKGAEFKAFIYDNGKEIEEYGFVWQGMDFVPHTTILGVKPKENNFSFEKKEHIYQHYKYTTYLYIKYEGKTLYSNTVYYEGKEDTPRMGVTSLPQSARPGEIITIIGKNFVPGIPIYVWVAGKPADIIHIEIDKITFKVPELDAQFTMVEIKREGQSARIYVPIEILK